MNRRLIVARIISVTGSLLLIVAAIHLLVTPLLKRAILDRVLMPQELRIVYPALSAESYCCRHSAHPSWIHYPLYCFGNTCRRTLGMGNQPCHWAYHPQPAGRARLSDARGIFPRRSISNSSRADNNSWDYNDGGTDISAT